MAAQVTAQPDVDWSRTYGGSAFESFRDVVATSDGGYVSVGTTRSANGTVTGYHGETDAWVVRVDATGALLWQRALGGTSFDNAHGVVQTVDGGFLVVGGTSSLDGDVSENLGGSDFWAVKLSPIGDILWERVYGGSDGEGAFAVVAQDDGTFVLAGFTQSVDGDITHSLGGFTDVWVIRISATGDLLQQRSFGGSSSEDAFALGAASDGSFVFIGHTASQDGDVGDNDHLIDDIWVAKFTFDDGLLWEHTYGSDEGTEFGYSIVETSEAGFWVLGDASAEGGDVQGLRGGQDGWVLRLDNEGALLWQRCLGGSDFDFLGDVAVLANGGVIVCGETNSTDGDVQSSIGGGDAWLVRLSDDGDLLWQRCYGGSAGDGFGSVLQHENGTYTLAGGSASSDGDVPGIQGVFDCWLLQLEPDFTSVSESVVVVELQLAPNPATTSLSVQHDVPTRATLTIHDARGALVRMEQGVFPARLTLSVEDLVPGMYRVSLTAEESVRAASFVRE